MYVRKSATIVFCTNYQSLQIVAVYFFRLSRRIDVLHSLLLVCRVRAPCLHKKKLILSMREMLPSTAHNIHTKHGVLNTAVTV